MTDKRNIIKKSVSIELLLLEAVVDRLHLNEPIVSGSVLIYDKHTTLGLYIAAEQIHPSVRHMAHEHELNRLDILGDASFIYVTGDLLVDTTAYVFNPIPKKAAKAATMKLMKILAECKNPCTNTVIAIEKLTQKQYTPWKKAGYII
jgi:hypothetical protein